MTTVDTTTVDTSHAGLLARISELEQANSELLRSNGELLEFASIAAHELRTPLQTIRGFAELLTTAPTGPPLTAVASGYLAGIERSTHRLSSIIDGLLSYARVGTNVRQGREVDCAVLLQESCAALAEPIKATSAKVSFDPLPVVIGDESELAVVFQNLLANALKYRRQEVAPRIHISVQQLLTTWQIQITDNGAGIALTNAPASSGSSKAWLALGPNLEPVLAWR